MEGQLCTDHMHILLSIPPKYRVSERAGYLRKRVVEAAKRFGKVRNITGESLGQRLFREHGRNRGAGNSALHMKSEKAVP